jgi:hypothetical protein
MRLPYFVCYFQGYTLKGVSNFTEEEAKTAEQRQRRQPDTNMMPHGLQHNPHQPNDKLALHRPEETIH